jgi:hypothetical protein
MTSWMVILALILFFAAIAASEPGALYAILFVVIAFLIGRNFRLMKNK